MRKLNILKKRYSKKEDNKSKKLYIIYSSDILMLEKWRLKNPDLYKVKSELLLKGGQKQFLTNFYYDPSHTLSISYTKVESSKDLKEIILILHNLIHFHLYNYTNKPFKRGDFYTIRHWLSNKETMKIGVRERDYLKNQIFRANKFAKFEDMYEYEHGKFEEKKEFLQRNRFLMNWLLAHSSLTLLTLVFVIAYLVGWIGFNNLRFSYADLLMHLAAFVNLGIVLYRPALLDGVTFKALVLRLHENERVPELDEQADKLLKYEKYAARLEAYFADEKPFLDPDLNLEKTATKLQISTRSLSRTTSYIYQLGYPDFVNSWRINYIVKHRKYDQKWQSYSQDMLAELSGFGSRQGLHNAVHRLHGTTPALFFASREQKA
jgi:AraC-like DNA-binding protein